MRKAGEGREVRFWIDWWVGNVRLTEKCSRLYSIALDKRILVSDLGVWEEGVWRWQWQWQWRRALFQWELAFVSKLDDAVVGASLKQGEVDGWL